MLTKAQVELSTMRGILAACAQDFETIDRCWPKSKRGSNADSAVRQLKDRIEVASACCEDAISALAEPPKDKGEGT